MMQTQTKKIGARVLSPEEIKATLPTYTTLREQIAQIRSQKWDAYDFSPLQNQTTNNIGILGSRGSGKTSIIKTLIRDLQEENKNRPTKENGKKLVQNIILPMIIPESMSENSNILSMILGLFKSEVDKISNDRSSDRNCWELTQPEIVNQYNELVKKFCLIQPDFKTVSIEQYTTENDYVRKSSEIYHADIDFLSCLNQFIESLLREEKFYLPDALIFIFIDDIDLSMHRCVDIVKTLLAYIAHPRIITILSGDLETFEEALTLDFSRKDDTLKADLLNQSFITSGTETFLERKQRLTYEYLRKIIPPLYRHYLRTWTLETRGDYRINADAEQNSLSKKEELPLAELLPLCFEDKAYCPIFRYAEPAQRETHGMGSGETETVMKNLPQMFHIFDSTARGLNNIYNILLSISQLTQDPDHPTDDLKFQQIKLILETIASSDNELSFHQNKLFEYVIRFGSDFDSTRIHLGNFTAYLEQGSKEYDPNVAKNNTDLTQDKGKLTGFKLFAFLDFALRALRQPLLLQDSVYKELKLRRIADLINLPAISGTLVSVPLMKHQRAVVDGPEVKIHSGETPSYEDTPFEEVTHVQRILFSFLSKLDFSYAMVLYQFLLERGRRILKKEDPKKQSGPENASNELSKFESPLLLSVYDLIKSLEQTMKEDKAGIIAELSGHFQAEFNEIASIFNSEKLPVVVRQIFSKCFETIVDRAEDKKQEKNPNMTKEEKKKKEKERNRRIQLLSNTFAGELKDLIFEENRLRPLDQAKKESYQEILKEILSNKEQSESEEGLKNQERLEIIFTIEEKKLWSNDYSAPVKQYIEERIEALLKRFGDINGESQVDVSILQNSYEKFAKIYKGSSATLANKLFRKLDRVGSQLKAKGGAVIPLAEYEELEERTEDLAYSAGARYGTDEASLMLSDLRKSRLLLDLSSENRREGEDMEKELFIWMHIYGLSTTINLESIYAEASEISEFVSNIYEGLAQSRRTLLAEYKNALLENPQISEETFSCFEELFPN